MLAGALICGLLAMGSYGLANAFSRPIIHRLGAVRLLWVRGLAIVAMLTVVALPSFGHLANWRAALAALGIGIFGYIPPLAFSQGIKVSRISIITPIASTAPLITVILSAVFLHARLHGGQWWGIGVIVLANVLASVNFRSLRDSNILKLASGVPYALTAALGWGVVFFLIIYPTRSIGPWLTSLLMEIGVVLAASVHVWLRREPFAVHEATRKDVLFNAALIAVGTLGFTIGVRSFNIGLVATLSNSNAVVSIIAATLWHHEHLTRAEKILAGLMIFGVVLVSLA